MIAVVILLLGGLEALALPMAFGTVWILAQAAVALGTAAGVLAFMRQGEPVVVPSAWSLLGETPTEERTGRDRLAA